MTLGDAVRDFVKDYTGTAGSQTIKAVELNSETTAYAPPTDGRDSGIQTTLQDESFQYAPS